MAHHDPGSRAIAFSVRLYTAMLRLYPSAFRAEYGEPMAQLFRDNCRRAYRRAGAAALLILWLRTLADCLRTTLDEYMNGGLLMTRSTFVKLSGWALSVGAVALLLGIVASTRPEYNPSNMLSRPIDRLAGASAGFLVVLGYLLCALGLTGLLVRYGRLAGSRARAGLGVSAVSAAIAGLGYAAWTLGLERPALPIFLLGTAFMFVGLLVFGVVCVRRRPLPRWNALPLLAAVWIPAAVLAAALYQIIRGDYLGFPKAVGVPLVLVSLGGLALLGYLLLTDQRALEARAPAA
jgi:hypothetical protein